MATLNLPKVVVGRDLGEKLPFSSFPVVIVEERLRRLYGAPLAQKMGAPLIVVPGGEKGKTERALKKLLHELFRLQVGKDALLIGVGGGATCDLVGFAASIYMRGVPFVLYPTTLLAMVDAAIGGKTGIDTPYGKNSIGSFSLPQAIFIDLATLETLPAKEWQNGEAEVLKLGLVWDPFLWNHPRALQRAIEGKLAIVSQDPYDQSIRRILNFGHTIGHALEAMTEYRISHGEAVMIGSLLEAHLSCSLRYLDKAVFQEIEARYQSYDLPKLPITPRFFELLLYDKKREGGQVRCVLIEEIGKAVPFDGTYCRSIGEKELRETMKYYDRSSY